MRPLRSKVTFERQATTQDAIGQRTQTWTQYGTARSAWLMPLAGSEFPAQSGVVSQISARMLVRLDATTRAIRLDDRVRHAMRSPNVLYNVVSIIDVNNRGRELLFELVGFKPQ